MRADNMEEATDEIGNISRGGNQEGNGQYRYNDQPSLLSNEENEALIAKDVQVVNPLIYQATHKEYLEGVKVSILL